MIRALFACFLLLCSQAFSDQVGLSVAQGELGNTIKTQQRSAFIQYDVSGNYYAEGLLIERDSDANVAAKDELFVGFGGLLTLSNAILKANFLLSNDTWRINPLVTVSVNNIYSISTGIIYRDLYHGKMSTTLLHAGINYQLGNGLAISSAYYNGHLTQRTEYDYFRIGLIKRFY